VLLKGRHAKKEGKHVMGVGGLGSVDILALRSGGNESDVSDGHSRATAVRGYSTPWDDRPNISALDGGWWWPPEVNVTRERPI